MNVLILNPILFTAEQYVIPTIPSIKDTMIYNLCQGFQALGHEVTLVAASEYMPQRKEEYDFEVKFFPSHFPKMCKPAVLPFSRGFRQWLSRNHGQYDLVISSEVFSLYSLTAARVCPEKTLIWHELDAHQKKYARLPSKLWHNVVARCFMQRVSCVVPRSEAAQRFISRYMPRVTDTIVDHGINTGKFLCSTEKKRQLISSSQLVPRKQVDGIIRKFHALHHTPGYEDIRLVIAGRGEEEDRLKRLVRELGLEAHTEFTGFLPQQELNKHIRESMAFLINSHKDLNMVSIPESIASGTPILTNLNNTNTRYATREHLGIAKAEWDETDLMEIIDNNPLYVERCVAYRERLSYTSCAGTLLALFGKQSHSEG